jgi:putative N-acetylmannosamine-6-phosphate epimerase
VQYAFQQIQEGNNSYRALKHNKLRNAIEILVGANAIKKNYDTLVITKTMEEIIKTISESPTIVFANAVLRENPKTLSIELGQLLNDEYQRTWTASSKMRYGNAIMNWVRYLNESKK